MMAVAASNPRLILASASPQRQKLLRAAGYEFVVHPSNVDEAALGADLLPASLARQLALAKAEAVAAQFPEDVVLAADTVVAFGDTPLGKPADPAAARQMLTLLAGTTHIIITGVAVIHRAAAIEQTEKCYSAVRMKPLTAGQIEAYVANGDWQGKAGGYGIQDNDPFVICLSGCKTNVIGLPMKLTAKMLAAAGVFICGPVGRGLACNSWA